MSVGNSVNIENRRRLERSVLEFYTPSDIKPNQELLSKTRFRVKVQLPSILKSLITAGILVGAQQSVMRQFSVGESFAAVGIGAGVGAGLGAILSNTGILKDEIVLTLVESVSGLTINGGNPFVRVDGGTGIAKKYHANNKDFGSVTIKFYREKDHEEFQRTMSFFHLFINFGMKCNMVIEKYSLSKELVSEILLEGVGFHSLSVDPLEKTTGGLWSYTLTGTVDIWNENLIHVT